MRARSVERRQTGSGRECATAAAIATVLAVSLAGHARAVEQTAAQAWARAVLASAPSTSATHEASAAIPAKIAAHRAAVSAYAGPAVRDEALERRLRFRAAVARDPSQYVWIACEAGGRSLRIVHGEDFGALQATSIANVARIAWSSLLHAQGGPSQHRCGEYTVVASEGYFDKQAFAVVRVTRAGIGVVPPTGLSYAMCAQQLNSGASAEQCPDLNARIVAAHYDMQSDLTHVVLTGSFTIPAASDEEVPAMHYTLYQH